MRFEGSTVTLFCISQIGTDGLQWFINGVPLQDPPLNNNITITSSDIASIGMIPTLVITNVSENIIIQCTTPSAQSNIATLLVQGMLVIIMS